MGSCLFSILKSACDVIVVSHLVRNPISPYVTFSVLRRGSSNYSFFLDPTNSHPLLVHIFQQLGGLNGLMARDSSGHAAAKCAGPAAGGLTTFAFGQSNMLHGKSS